MDFIDEFIQEYKNNPCLWKADSVDFKNRIKRQEAYLKLIDVAANHGEHYNVERTKQKINNLRCAFRHQLKKKNEFQNKGAQNEEPYCPKRKYFESLMFLKDEENSDKTARKAPQRNDSSTKNISNHQVVTTEILQIEPAEIEDLNKKTYTSMTNAKTTEASFIEFDEKSLQNSQEIEILDPSEGKSSIEMQIIYDYEKEVPSTYSNLPSSRKRSSSLSSQQSNTDTEPIPAKISKNDFSTKSLEKLFTLACKNYPSGSMEDHFSNFGKIVAHKLRTMESSQSIYAEKIIADVLYQGQMKLLSSLSINRFIPDDSPNSF